MTSAEPRSRRGYRVGSAYAIAAAILLATQEPFSALAARQLSPLRFLCVTQVALMASIPLLLLPSTSRKAFVALLANPANYWKLAVLFLIGLCGLSLYYVGLGNAHPIVITAILNLSPFWAALVARGISRRPIPLSPLIFFSCLAVASAGALAVAHSQTADASGDGSPSLSNLLRGSWYFAIPIPAFFALGGTLVGRWFRNVDESASIAANFLVSSAIIIPFTLIASWVRADAPLEGGQIFAVALLIVGTCSAASAGRVVYQMALTKTRNDNGFVTMFFMLIPALAALVTIPLSWWIADLRFHSNPLFYLGLLLIAAPLLLFSWKAWGDAPI